MNTPNDLVKCEKCQQLFAPDKQFLTICEECENESCEDCGELIEDCTCEDDPL